MYRLQIVINFVIQEVIQYSMVNVNVRRQIVINFVIQVVIQYSVTSVMGVSVEY